MRENTTLEKLGRHLRDEGVRETMAASFERLRKELANGAEGTPGYYRLRLWLLTRRYDLDDVTPVRIDPDEITALTGSYERRERGHLDYVPHFKPREARWDSLPYEAEATYGSDLGGDWDRRREPFSKLLMYRGVRQRFVDGNRWEETEYYSALVDRFERDGWDSGRAAERAMTRCDRIERMYETIDARGYRSQRELNGNPLHEVTVNIARDGTPLYNCEGRHRLSIAKVLGVERIPALVLIRHREHETTSEEHAMLGEQ